MNLGWVVLHMFADFSLIKYVKFFTYILPAFPDIFRQRPNFAEDSQLWSDLGLR